jgi:hypothetical protein
MKKRLIIGLYIAISIPIVLHFFHLIDTLQNTPTWTDDFLFLEMIPKLFEGANISSILQQLFAPHNEIHRIAFGRVFVALYYFFFHEVDFKQLTILANLQMLVILIAFFQYLKKENLSYFHLIPITYILFSAFGNLDTYTLIGSLQHTSSILFMVWISYGILYFQDKKWIIFLTLFYPFVSTEGLVFIPVIGLILVFQKNKWTPWYGILGLSIIAFYVFQYHPKQATNISFKSSDLLEIVQAFLGFIGIFRLPFSDSYRMEIAIVCGVFVMGFLIFTCLNALKKNTLNSLGFPLLIYVQIMLTGVLICIGRFPMGDILSTSITERFLTYGLIGMILVYLLMINQFAFLRNNAKIGSILSLVFFITSTYFSIVPTKVIAMKLKADLINTFYQKKSSTYEGQIDHFNSLHNPKYYQFPKHLIPSSASLDQGFKNATFFPMVGDYYYKTDKNIRTIYFENLPIKKLHDRYLVIRSIKVPSEFMFSPLLQDENPSKPKKALVWMPKKSLISGNDFFIFSLDNDKVIEVIKLKGEPSFLK